MLWELFSWALFGDFQVAAILDDIDMQEINDPRVERFVLNFNSVMRRQKEFSDFKSYTAYPYFRGKETSTSLYVHGVFQSPPIDFGGVFSSKRKKENLKLILDSAYNQYIMRQSEIDAIVHDISTMNLPSICDAFTAQADYHDFPYSFSEVISVIIVLRKVAGLDTLSIETSHINISRLVERAERISARDSIKTGRHLFRELIDIEIPYFADRLKTDFFTSAVMNIMLSTGNSQTKSGDLVGQVSHIAAGETLNVDSLTGRYMSFIQQLNSFAANVARVSDEYQSSMKKTIDKNKKDKEQQDRITRELALHKSMREVDVQTQDRILAMQSEYMVITQQLLAEQDHDRMRMLKEQADFFQEQIRQMQGILKR